MAYLGKTPSQAVRSRYYFTASGGETSLSPSEVTGLSFTDANYVDVSLNGVALVSGTDYTATPSTNTISGLAALTASDVVEIVVYDTFSVFGGNVNGDFNISGGTLSAEAVTVTGLTTTGNVNFGDNDKAIFGAGSDLQIYHDATDSHVVTTNGDLNLQVAGAGTINLGDQFGNTLLKVVDNADVKLYHGTTPSEKLATTSSGIDVTGTVTADGLTVDSSGGGLTFSGGGNTFISATSSPLIFQTSSGTERMRITGTGLVSIGDSLPDAKLDVRSTSGTTTDIGIFEAAVGGYTGTSLIAANTLGPASTYNLFECITDSDADAGGPFTEFVVRGDGNVGIGKSAPASALHISNSTYPQLEIDDNASRNYAMGVTSSTFRIRDVTGTTDRLIIDSSGVVGIGVVPSGTAKLQVNGQIYASSDGSESAPAFAVNDGDTGMFRVANNTLGFTTAGTERMRIDSGGSLTIPGGDTSPQDNTSGNGICLTANGEIRAAVGSALVADFNRMTNDGTVILIRGQGVAEGSIEVNGSTVSLNGGHLSRWSQTTDGQRISGLLRGTVMTNLDQMAVWSHDEVLWAEDDELPDGVSVGDVRKAAYTEDNEQLNCMAVSSVEGDANVAGVFQNWDEDDDFNDMLVALTGDFIIRIAQGTTVARGDLLMSAGDGTAKPQGDDIVRSKTIAKVTSTTVSHTYDDGSYLVPCVLMAC